MEENEKEIIKKNMSKLIEYIQCDTTVLVHLYSAGTLSLEEKERLGLIFLTPSQRADQLLTIVQAKTGGFEALKKALGAANKTGALDLLNCTNCSISEKGSGSSSAKSVIVGQGDWQVGRILSLWKDSEQFSLFEEKLAVIANGLNVSTLKVHEVKKDRLLNKLSLFEAVQEILMAWVGKHGMAATLDKLINTLRSNELAEFADRLLLG